MNSLVLVVGGAIGRRARHLEKKQINGTWTRVVLKLYIRITYNARFAKSVKSSVGQHSSCIGPLCWQTLWMYRQAHVLASLDILNRLKATYYMQTPDKTHSTMPWTNRLSPSPLASGIVFVIYRNLLTIFVEPHPSHRAFLESHILEYFRARCPQI